MCIYTMTFAIDVTKGLELRTKNLELFNGNRIVTIPFCFCNLLDGTAFCYSVSA